MKLDITYKKVVDRVFIQDADKINKAELARKLGVSRAMASHMLISGDIPARFIEPLRAIKLSDVLSRKSNGG